MRPLAELSDRLKSMDGRGYGGYKSVRGAWGDDALVLGIDHVQGDPFAAPSRVHLAMPAQVHGIPAGLWSTGVRRAALTDFVLRRFGEAARAWRAAGHEGGGSGRSGELAVDAGGAEILARSGCGFVGTTLHLRFRVGLPARGRRILGHQAARLLCEVLPQLAAKVCWAKLDAAEAERFVSLADDHAYVQAQLADRNLVAFVRDGAVLPRRSGVCAEPLPGAIAFRSPPSLRVELPTLHHGPVSGMGVPAGVTLVTGGGFHGKTTLLQALTAGIDPHVPGDGREWVVTAPDVVKLRSEDGRSVVGVDLRPFIGDLPHGRPTASFETPDASGSTSLAAAIIEALALGASAMLLDEDTSATNLLIRDARMQALVARETITPLIDRVAALHREHGVSTVLVVGGSGDYLEVADRVLMMQDYLPQDVTARAAEVAAQHPTGRVQAAVRPIEPAAPRRVDLRCLCPTRGRDARVRAHGLRELAYGEAIIELSALEQLVDGSQVRAIGALMGWLHRHGEAGATIRALADAATTVAAEQGLFEIGGSGELAAVRRYELAGAINRMRGLQLL